jgi:hypothetical protein
MDKVSEAFWSAAVSAAVPGTPKINSPLTIFLLFSNNRLTAPWSIDAGMRQKQQQFRPVGQPAFVSHTIETQTQTRTRKQKLTMKKLSSLAAAILVTAWSTNALNFASTNSATSSPSSSLPLSDTTASPSARAAKKFAAFRLYRTYLDKSFLRIKSIQQAALQLHTTVAAMDEVFRPYAHEDANKYLMSLKRTQTQTAALPPQNEKLVAHQQNTSPTDAYAINR